MCTHNVMYWGRYDIKGNTILNSLIIIMCHSECQNMLS